MNETVAGLPIRKSRGNSSRQQEGRMYPVKVAKVVAFACGCICEYPLEGHFAEMKEWHIFACKKHTEERYSMPLRAEMTWGHFNKVTEKPKRTAY